MTGPTTPADGTTPVVAPWKRLLLRHAIVAVVAFGAAWVIGAFVVFPDTGPAPTVIVPPVVGLAFDEAQAKLTALGLRAALGESRPSSSAPRRFVLAQTPAAGATVEPNERVLLDVSAGQLRATIPRLVGMTRDDAMAALRDAKLDVGEVTERPGTEARGTVLATRPDAGQVVSQGTAVDLTLSAGPTQLLMPDVVGRELYEARATLEQLGLRLAQTEYDSTSVLPAGLVVSQLPAAGAPVTATDVITLRISGRP